MTHCIIIFINSEFNLTENKTQEHECTNTNNFLWGCLKLIVGKKRIFIINEEPYLCHLLIPQSSFSSNGAVLTRN